MAHENASILFGLYRHEQHVGYVGWVVKMPETWPRMLRIPKQRPCPIRIAKDCPGSSCPGFHCASFGTPAPSLILEHALFAIQLSTSQPFQFIPSWDPHHLLLQGLGLCFGLRRAVYDYAGIMQGFVRSLSSFKKTLVRRLQATVLGFHVTLRVLRACIESLLGCAKAKAASKATLA